MEGTRAQDVSGPSRGAKRGAIYAGASGPSLPCAPPDLQCMCEPLNPLAIENRWM